MTKAILAGGAALAAAAVVAGCGGTGGTNSAGTTSGVAGVQATRTDTSFRLQVQAFEAQLQKAVGEFRSGHLGAAASSGSGLLTNCIARVNGLATRATTKQERAAVKDLRSACGDMTSAAQKGSGGNLSQAKSLAERALSQAKLAVEELR